jgi:hypothetical protein
MDHQHAPTAVPIDSSDADAALSQMTRTRYEQAPRFAEFLERAVKHAQLWRDTYRLVRVPDEALERAARIAGGCHLVVLVEDWCGDAVNTVPIVARLAELTPGLDLRVLERDRNPDIMDAHLTNGTRSIPLVIVYDAAFRELGGWGPRPAELQAWATTIGRTLEKDERYRHIRTWYARDRGRTTLNEVLDVVERATVTTPAGCAA